VHPFQKPSFEFGDPFVVTLINFFHDSICHLRVADCLLYKFSLAVLPFIASMKSNSVSNLSFIPCINISHLDVSLASVLSSSIIKKHMNV
jgi:hypothetical protein